MYIIIPMEKEIFVPIIYRDIKNMYLISNYGRVKNYKTGNILKPFLDKDGYERICLSVNNDFKNRKIYIHRLVALHFVVGKTDKRCIVNHKDSNVQFNYFENLEWVTPKENTEHGIKHGNITHSDAFKYSQRKYPEELINKICSYLERGFTIKQILKLIVYPKGKRRTYKTLIVDIRSGRSWLNISSKYKIDKE